MTREYDSSSRIPDGPQILNERDVIGHHLLLRWQIADNRLPRLQDEADAVRRVIVGDNHPSRDTDALKERTRLVGGDTLKPLLRNESVVLVALPSGSRMRGT